MVTKPIENTSSSTAGAYESEFNRSAEQIGNAFKEIVNKFNAAIQHINDNRILLAPLMGRIKEQLDRMRKQMDKLKQLVKYFAEHHAPVLSLIVQSFKWLENIHRPMSNLSSDVTTYRKDSLRAWSGPARETYDERAGKQKGAVDDVVKKADFISKWLFDIVKTNVAYAAMLAGTLAKVLGALAQAAVDAATVVGIPWALDALADSVGTLVEDGIVALVKYAENFVAALGNLRDVLAEFGSGAIFKDGKWPEAVRN